MLAAVALDHGVGPTFLAFFATHGMRRWPGSALVIRLRYRNALPLGNDVLDSVGNGGNLRVVPQRNLGTVCAFQRA